MTLQSKPQPLDAAAVTTVLRLVLYHFGHMWYVVTVDSQKGSVLYIISVSIFS